MAKYKIINIKEEYRQLFMIYPLASLFYIRPKDSFEVKQVELLFYPMDKATEFLLELLKAREDYSYYHGIHYIHNPLTNEKIAIQFHQFDIEVEEDDEKHVIFDIISSFSINFYMIKA